MLIIAESSQLIKQNLYKFCHFLQQENIIACPMSMDVMGIRLEILIESWDRRRRNLLRQCGRKQCKSLYLTVKSALGVPHESIILYTFRHRRVGFSLYLMHHRFDSMRSQPDLPFLNRSCISVKAMNSYAGNRCTSAR